MNQIKHILSATALSMFTACSGIDCTLDSVVVWTLTFYDSETEEPLKLPCTLTVDAEGAGTLFNKGRGISSMALPMSHSAAADTLYLRWSTATTTADPEESAADSEATDILFVKHDNAAHFDAIDCPAAVFHTITEATLMPRSVTGFPLSIDSLRIIRSQVDYSDVENIRLYLNLSAFDSSNSRHSK